MTQLLTLANDILEIAAIDADDLDLALAALSEIRSVAEAARDNEASCLNDESILKTG